MGGLNIIMTRFLPSSSCKNSWIFKPKTIVFTILGTSFCHEHVKCYELQQVMRQHDEIFIDILNRFQTTSYIIKDISFYEQMLLKNTTFK